MRDLFIAQLNNVKFEQIRMSIKHIESGASVSFDYGSFETLLVQMISNSQPNG